MSEDAPRHLILAATYSEARAFVADNGLDVRRVNCLETYDDCLDRICGIRGPKYDPESPWKIHVLDSFDMTPTTKGYLLSRGFEVA